MAATDQRQLSRRRAIQIGALAGVGGAAAAAYKLGPWSRPLGANADIRLGFAGLGGKGEDHLKHFREIHGCRVVALCDPDPEPLARQRAICEAANESVRCYADYRDLIADKEVDAVVIASPNHWHALMGVWALEAGKPIYIEKPLTHSIWEGEVLAETAERTGLVAQTGIQRRSDMAYAEAREWIAEGHIGALRRARAIVYRHRNRVTKRKSPTVLPAGLDYDLWCGPALEETLYRPKLHYDWHWVWNTGNGELGNNGIHFIDVARWLLGDPGLPRRTLSVGGRFAWEQDAGETPNTQLTLFEGDVPILAEVRNLPMRPGYGECDHLHGVREGVVLECEGGVLAWPRALDDKGKKIKKFSSSDGHGHRVNWLKAIVDSEPGSVNAPLRNGHMSTTYCNLGNLSFRLGGEAGDEAGREAVEKGAAADVYQAILEHLAINEVVAPEREMVIGEAITTDEGILSSPGARQLDRREYRAPYTLAVG